MAVVLFLPAKVVLVEPPRDSSPSVPLHERSICGEWNLSSSLAVEPSPVPSTPLRKGVPIRNSTYPQPVRRSLCRRTEEKHVPGPMNPTASAALVIKGNDTPHSVVARICALIRRSGSMVAWAAGPGIGPVASLILGANASALKAAPLEAAPFSPPSTEELLKTPPARAERTSHDWTIYQNARFGTRFAYPADIFGQGRQSDNGDGITLRSLDGATLAIFGQWNIDDLRPAAWLSRLAREPRYRRIAYRLVRPNLVIASGRTRSRIFYERYAFEGPGGAIHAFVLEYPASAQTRYGPIISRMSASLTWVATGLR